MPANEDLYIEIDGQRRRVVFSAELSDGERTRMGYPKRGTPCACPDCDCTNHADMGTPENPICSCCFADCPDVHGPATTRESAATAHD